MPKVTTAQTRAREEEIIDACKKLYEKMSFNEITIKEISNFTTFTRTSIYNYFRTKEEIFLSILKDEYRIWTEDLGRATDKETINREELADILASTLSERILLLKILSMNIYDIEKNSRLERLIEFKVVFKRSMEVVGESLKKVFPDIDQKGVDDFIYAFYPFFYGIYPYTFLTDKQIKAMDAVGITYHRQSVYEMTYLCVKRLLGIE